MASRLGIFNDALSLIGDVRLSDPDTTTQQAAADLRAVWDSVRRRVLSRHPWNDAIARWQLAADPTAPEFGWSYRYGMPTDPEPLKIIKIHGDPPFSREGRFILTNASAPLYVVGIADIAPDVMSDSLAALMGAELALQVVQKRAESFGLRDRLQQEVSIRDQTARMIDTAEGVPEHVVDSDFLRARGGWGDDRLTDLLLSQAEI